MPEIDWSADRIVSQRSGATWEPVIGLEVHCQLQTRTKLFCGCRSEFGAPPNSNTCPICTGQPGALPVLNGEALALALRAALAFGAEVATSSKFDRKNYFYCDLPKGYQISQFDRPFCRGGGVQLASGRTVRFNRIHIEEDAGKAIHDRGATTLVDLNRAGVPLIESVTEADVHSSQEAFDALATIRETLRFAGVSDCDMEKGSLRCDVNISVHHPNEPWGTKVELKNLNSLRNIKDAIEHELERQIAAYETGAEEIVQETRLYDPDARATRPMRSKENAHDYRYFPDPDLPVVTVDDAFLAAARAALPESAPSRRERYRERFGLSEYDAEVLTGTPDIANYFDRTVALGADPQDAAKWIANDVFAALGDAEVPGSRVDELRVEPEALVELMALVADGTLHRGGARQALRAMLLGGGTARDVVRALGLEQVSDADALESLCRAALVGQADTVADVRAGKTKAIGALMGKVMKASGGKANPKLVQAILLRLIQAPS